MMTETMRHHEVLNELRGLQPLVPPLSPFGAILSFLACSFANCAVPFQQPQDLEVN